MSISPETSFSDFKDLVFGDFMGLGDFRFFLPVSFSGQPFDEMDLGDGGFGDLRSFCLPESFTGDPFDEMDLDDGGFGDLRSFFLPESFAGEPLDEIDLGDDSAGVRLT